MWNNHWKIRSDLLGKEEGSKQTRGVGWGKEKDVTHAFKADSDSSFLDLMRRLQGPFTNIGLVSPAPFHGTPLIPEATFMLRD